MDSLRVIRRLHEHRFWSNRQLRDVARTLTQEQLEASFEIGQGSIMATLTHLYAAEYVWLAALEGQPDPPSPFTFQFDSLAALEQAWDELDSDWQYWLDALDVCMLDQPVVKKSTSSMAGQTVATPVIDVLIHVCTHAQYTTAQAANIFRRLGIEPPDTMLISLSRSQASGAE